MEATKLKPVINAIPAGENKVAEINILGKKYITTNKGVYDVENNVWQKGPWGFKYLVDPDSWD